MSDPIAAEPIERNNSNEEDASRLPSQVSTATIGSTTELISAAAAPNNTVNDAIEMQPVQQSHQQQEQSVPSIASSSQPQTADELRMVELTAADERISYFDLFEYPSGTSFIQISRQIERQAIASQLAQLLIFFATSVLLMASGREGTNETLGGIGVAISIFNVVAQSVTIGFLGAIDTLVSQSVGRKSNQEAAEVTVCAMAVGLVLCVPFTIIFMFLPEELVLLLFGAKFVDVAATFLRWSVPQIVIFTVNCVLVKSLQAEQKAGTPFRASVVGLVVALISAFTLVPFFGPSIGMPLSLAVCYLSQIFANILLAPNDAVFKLVNWSTKETWLCSCERPKLDLFLRVGWDSYKACALEWLSVEIMLMLCSRPSQLDASVAAILINLLNVVWCFADGLSVASSAIIGGLLGARHFVLARVYARVFSIWGVICAGVGAAIFASQLLFGLPWLVMLYTKDDDVIALLSQPLYSVTFFFYAEAIAAEFILLGIFRGCKRAELASMPCAVGMWAVGLGLATLATIVFPAGGTVVVACFSGFATGAWVFVALLLWRLSQFDWKELAAEASREAVVVAG